MGGGAGSGPVGWGGVGDKRRRPMSLHVTRSPTTGGQLPGTTQHPPPWRHTHQHTQRTSAAASSRPKSSSGVQLVLLTTSAGRPSRSRTAAGPPLAAAVAVVHSVWLGPSAPEAYRSATKSAGCRGAARAGSSFRSSVCFSCNGRRAARWVGGGCRGSQLRNGASQPASWPASSAPVASDVHQQHCCLHSVHQPGAGALTSSVAGRKKAGGRS